MYSAPPTWAKPGPALSLSHTHSLVLPYLSLSLSLVPPYLSLSHTHTDPALSLSHTITGRSRLRPVLVRASLALKLLLITLHIPENDVFGERR